MRNWFRVSMLIGIVCLLIAVGGMVFTSLQTSSEDPQQSVEPGNTMEESIISSSLDPHETTSDDVGLSDSDLDAYYAQAHNFSNDVQKYELIAGLYEATGDLEYVPYLIDQGIDLGKTEELRERLAALELHTPEVVSAVGAERIVMALYTMLPLTITTYEKLKNVVNDYHDTGYITTAQKHYYYSLIALAKGHIDDFEYFALESQLPHLQTIIETVQHNQQQYTYAPDYYALGLYGVAMYELGWYRVTDAVGNILQELDETYITGYQLEARSAMRIGDWERTIPLAQKVQDLEPSPEQGNEYQYLEAVAYYYQGDDARAVLIFNQLQKTQRAYEAARYLLLLAGRGSYDLTQAVQKLQEHELNAVDYYAVSMFFYPPYDQDIDTVSDALGEVLEQCSIVIDPQYRYVCLVGRAGQLVHAGQDDKAIALLEQLTKKYPTSVTREILGLLQHQQGDLGAAKQSLLQSVRYANSDDQEQVKQRVFPLIQKKL